MSDIVERLRKRAKEDQTCADNNQAVVEALSEQMRLFDAREGHNVYAVRMAVDHKSGMERDRRYAADLTEAADLITRLRDELASARAAAFEEAEQIADRMAHDHNSRVGAAISAAIRSRAQEGR